MALDCEKAFEEEMKKIVKENLAGVIISEMNIILLAGLQLSQMPFIFLKMRSHVIHDILVYYWATHVVICVFTI